MSKHFERTTHANLVTPAQDSSIFEYEKVAVRSIKIVHPGLRATGIVSSFFAVDKLLGEWMHRFKGVLDCAFEIVYEDGRTISGNYRFRRKGTTRPALMRFVRASAQAMCDNARGPCSVTGLTLRPSAFLEHYETEDFARV